jgi:hypothetical protein
MNVFGVPKYTVNSDFQEPDKTVNALFGGLPNRRSQKATR